MMANQFSLEESHLQRCSFAALRPEFSSGRSKPSELLEKCIEKIEAIEPEVGAFVSIDLDGARKEATESDARWKTGKTLSPIDGMPVGIKDVMETRNMPTEQGSPLFLGWRGNRDCAAVSALREAGAVIVSKTVTTEFAATQPRGTRNPWDLERTPGGSSSGSAAAVGIGMLSGALGSQVIGSIIRPASFCGAVGYKPSVGGVNRGGSFDGFSQSCTGALGASLADSWNMIRAITARAGGDAGYIGVIGPMELPDPAIPRKIMFLETAGWKFAEEEAKGAIESAISAMERSGIEIITRERSDLVEAIEEVIEDAGPLSRQINAWEGKWPLNTYARDMDSDKLSKPSKERLSEANKMSQEQFSGLLARRYEARKVFASAQNEFDCCVTLSATGGAPLGLESTGNPIFTVPTSMLGIPTISLPALTCAGLPLGIQIMGFEGKDADLFAAAGAIERILLN
jgi:Asp-tRNA(Asn)/Glu-tRNA(Gln) amidotransferase A subunit family amidase